MAKTQYIIGRGTKLNIAHLDCTLVYPTPFTITVATAITTSLSTVTSISVTATTNTLTVPASTNKPVYILFVDPVTGREVPVAVVADIATGATTLTIAAGSLKFPLAAASVAEYPVRLSARSNANFSPKIAQVEVDSFDNDGWDDFVQTGRGGTLTAQGPYLPLDPGWRTVLWNWQNFGKFYAQLIFPPPGCENVYTTGHTVSGVVMCTNQPIEAGAKAIIQSNIDLQFCGPITWTDPT